MFARGWNSCGMGFLDGVREGVRTCDEVGYGNC